MVRVLLYLARGFDWFPLLWTSTHLSATMGKGSASANSWFGRFLGVFSPSRRELVVRYRVRRLVQKHLALHFMNFTPRDGVAQLPWVKRGGVRSGVESVQGHVGSTRYLTTDFARLIGWAQRKIAHAAEVVELHELDEFGAPDESLWSMDQKLDPSWRPLARDEWYERRRRGYFEEGGRERVTQFLERFPSWERSHVLSLCDEFYAAKTDVARLANQMDDFQAVMESAARYIKFLSSLRFGAKTIEDARENFFDSYLPQGEQIMEWRVMIIALEVLVEEIEKEETAHRIPRRERKVFSG